MMFIGLFMWILLQSTCFVENSSLEYIPAHAIMHLCFVYGASLIEQYYIFLYNDIKGNRMVLSSRMTNSNKCLDALFPYFMAYRGIFQDETERMLNDMKPLNKESSKQTSVNQQSQSNKAGDLRETITTLNSQRKKRRQEQKLRKQREKANAKRQVRYDEFDVDDYVNDHHNNNTIYNATDDQQEIELEMVETNKNGNDVQEEDNIVYSNNNDP